MLKRNAQGSLEDVAVPRTGQETQDQADARALLAEVRRLRDEHPDPEIRLLSDALLTLCTRLRKAGII